MNNYDEFINSDFKLTEEFKNNEDEQNFIDYYNYLIDCYTYTYNKIESTKWIKMTV